MLPNILRASRVILLLQGPNYCSFLRQIGDQQHQASSTHTTKFGAWFGTLSQKSSILSEVIPKTISMSSRRETICSTQIPTKINSKHFTTNIVSKLHCGIRELSRPWHSLRVSVTYCRAWNTWSTSSQGPSAWSKIHYHLWQKPPVIFSTTISTVLTFPLCCSIFWFERAWQHGIGELHRYTDLGNVFLPKCHQQWNESKNHQLCQANECKNIVRI